ncbi:MAG: hypothetical protein ACKVTZ_00670 [Bacteroidia bacterium]
MKTYQLKKIIFSDNLELAIREVSKFTESLNIEKYPLFVVLSIQQTLEKLSHDLSSLERRTQTGVLDRNFVKTERLAITNQLLNIVSKFPQDVDPEEVKETPKVIAAENSMIGLVGIAMALLMMLGTWAVVRATQDTEQTATVFPIENQEFNDTSVDSSVIMAKENTNSNMRQ